MSLKKVTTLATSKNVRGDKKGDIDLTKLLC